MEHRRTTTLVKRVKMLRSSHPMRFEKCSIPLGKYAAFGLSTVLALFAAGCTVGPRYRKPVTPIPPFHNAPSIELPHAGITPPELDTLWTWFGDPELNNNVVRDFNHNLPLSQI